MSTEIITIIQISVTVLVAFITAFLTNVNERRKQTTVYFKQEGIKTQREILAFSKIIRIYFYNLLYKINLFN